MNDRQIAKIKQFLADKEMQETIKVLLQGKFLERKGTDIHYLAAQTLSIQFLEDAWSEMERYRQNETKKPSSTQVGL